MSSFFEVENKISQRNSTDGSHAASLVPASWSSASDSTASSDKQGNCTYFKGCCEIQVNKSRGLGYGGTFKCLLLLHFIYCQMFIWFHKWHKVCHRMCYVWLVFFFFFGYVWFYLPCFHVGQSIHLNPLCIHKPRIPRQLKIVWSKYLALRSSYCEWRNTTRTNICSNIKSHKSVVQTVNVQRAHCAADFVPSLKVHGLFINGNR